MHTYTGKKATFHYNSDLSGVVHIRSDAGQIEVEGEDLLDFVAEHVRMQRITRLEDMTTAELLDLLR